MANSIDGNKVSISVRQLPQAGEDLTAARIAAAVSRTKLDSLGKIWLQGQQPMRCKVHKGG